MEKTIPQQLAAHIDETFELNVSQFFNEDGTLRPYQPGESVFAFTIACSLVTYEAERHDEYLVDVENMIQGDINGLESVLESVQNFDMPAPRFKVGDKVFWTDPDENLCSGDYVIVAIHGEIYALANESGSEVEALLHELADASEVQA